MKLVSKIFFFIKEFMVLVSKESIISTITAREIFKKIWKLLCHFFVVIHNILE